jgi:glycosyltransferase involved in cell wall biosynthesis
LGGPKNNTPPRVSIVTPVRNAVRFLPELIASVRAQDHTDIEHIVVDGGSTDGTLDLLRAVDGLAWTSEPDRGMYDALVKGLRRSSGAIVGYLNADDRYAGPDAVSRAVAALAAHPEVDVVYGDYRLIDAAGRPGREVRARPFDVEVLGRYNFIPPHSTFLRRAVLADEGLWPDPELQYCGDWEWFLRLAAAGRVFLHVPGVLSEFRTHRGSKTASTSLLLKAREWARVCRRHRLSLARLVLYEAALMPLRRRFSRPKPMARG